MDHSNLTGTMDRHNAGLVILVVLVMISTACQPMPPSAPSSTATPFSIVEKELRRKQQKWQDAGISRYRFRLSRGCICLENEDVLIEVENGQFVSLEYQSGKPIASWDRTEFENWSTMERLFLTIEEELNSGSLKVTVIYDPTYGFPVEISSERSAGSDDELNLTVSDFEVLP